MQTQWRGAAVHSCPPPSFPSGVFAEQLHLAVAVSPCSLYHYTLCFQRVWLILLLGTLPPHFLICPSNRQLQNSGWFILGGIFSLLVRRRSAISDSDTMFDNHEPISSSKPISEPPVHNPKNLRRSIFER